MKLPDLARGNGGNVRLLIIGAGLICLLLCAQHHFCLALVIGQSMRPGLSSGDLLLVDKQAYRQAEPQRGDIVLACYRRDLIVKRVVGLPEEEVELHRGHLYINGHLTPERHPIEPGLLNIARGRLFEGRFALLGDNRSLAPSQIVHAVVPKSQIVGKVIGSLHPRDQIAQLAWHE